MNSITRKQILLFYSRVFRKSLGHNASFRAWYFKKNMKIYGIQKKGKRMIEDLNPRAMYIDSKNKH